MVVNMDRRKRDFVGCACDLFPVQSTQQWRKLIMYSKDDTCLNCGESLWYPHQPTCVWSDDNRLNTVTCGDCLRTDCAGCEV
jgi:hypothetical protein